MLKNCWVCNCKVGVEVESAFGIICIDCNRRAEERVIGLRERIGKIVKRMEVIIEEGKVARA
jgi:hypothetical protein